MAGQAAEEKQPEIKAPTGVCGLNNKISFQVEDKQRAARLQEAKVNNKRLQHMHIQN